jgi:hypothetical protein
MVTPKTTGDALARLGVDVGDQQPGHLTGRGASEELAGLRIGDATDTGFAEESFVNAEAGEHRQVGGREGMGWSGHGAFRYWTRRSAQNLSRSQKR